ncbi:hypothetical protein ACSFA3_21825 [Variovorax sp. RHLX14]|uniref:hypothetical protein n=1 Tax=Variovorax sp. RHLX14 TaxID=1259731 RepID=UPI003F47E36B
MGNTALMKHLHVLVDDLKLQAEAMRTQGASVIGFAVNGQPEGLVAVSDPIKATTIKS